MGVNSPPLTGPFATVMLPNRPALNPQVREALLIMAGSVPDKGSHMPTGKSFFDKKWLSPNKLHLLEDTPFWDLARAIEATANRLRGGSASLSITSMWSIISRTGMEGRPHDHKGVLSVAYYVDAGISGDHCGGLLQFYAEAGRADPTHSVSPKTGLLVLFPSAVFHSVSRYTGTAPRIVISANLR